MEKKTRKEVSGPIRNKDRTKQKLIETVGEILDQEGFHGLTITNLAKFASFNAKLVYLYFGGLDELIKVYLEQYLSEKTESAHLAERMLTKPADVVTEDLLFLIEKRLQELLEDGERQGILHWELGIRHRGLRAALEKSADKLPVLLKSLEKSTDDRIKQDGFLEELTIVDAGLTFLGILSQKGEGTFLGVDIKDEKDLERIGKTVERLLNRY